MSEVSVSEISQEAAQATPGEAVSSLPEATIATEDFFRVIGNVAVFASRDDARPILTGIRLRFEDGRMIGEATDSHRLAEDSCPAEGSSFTGIWPARPLADAAKEARRAAKLGQVTLWVNDDQSLTVSWYGASRTIHRLEGAFPDTGRLWPTEDFEPVGGTIGFWAAQLADFAKVRAPAETRYVPPLRLSIQSPQKPAVIRIGETFRALLMPVRLPD